MAEEPLAGPSAAPAASEPIALSKRQQKKQAKRAALDATKAERRALERQKRKRKRAERHEAIANGEQVEPLPKRKRRTGQSSPFNATLVIELAWDHLMTPRVRVDLTPDAPRWTMSQETISMVQQISQTYGSVRLAKLQPALLCTSFGARVKEKLDKQNDRDYLRWKNMVFEERDLGKLIEEGRVKREEVVYLTADSPNVLETLDEGQTYVIGGIVDRNRHKNLCFERAKELNVRHAQLPIGQYVKEMPSRRVLTVNQVCQILFLWLESRDWESAFYEVIPRRKFKSKEAENKDSGTEGGQATGKEEDGAHGEPGLEPKPEVQRAQGSDAASEVPAEAAVTQTDAP